MKKTTGKTVKIKKIKKDEELKVSDLSREQIFDLADAAGRKLGFLLTLSPLKDEVKEAIMKIIEFATPAQLDKFTQMLEENYLKANNKNLEENFKKEIENLKTDFEENEKKLDEKISSSLTAIEEKIK